MKQDATSSLNAISRARKQGATSGPSSSNVTARAGKTGLLRSKAREPLCEGRPFPPSLAARFEAILGAPVTEEGLTGMYGECMSSGRAVLVDVHATDPHTLRYDVHFLSPEGQVVAKSARILRRHTDGSLELHRKGSWVEPEWRGEALSAGILEREISLLGRLSDHRRTRITLRAGFSGDLRGGHEQRVGTYLWAMLGLDFADRHGLRSALFRYIPRSRSDPGVDAISDLALLKKAFAVWVDAHVRAGEIPAELVPVLLKRAKSWKTPFDIATFDIPSLTIRTRIGGEERDVHIGKAFLTADDTPSWDGSLFVREWGKPRCALGRKGAAYCAGQIERSREARARREKRWVTALDSDDPSMRRDAIQEIGRHGDATWSETLAQIRRDRARGDEALLDGTIDALSGPGPTIARQQRIAMEDGESADPHERWNAVARLIALEGRLDLDRFRTILADETSPTLRRSALLELSRRDAATAFLVDEASRILRDTPVVARSPAEGALLLDATDALLQIGTPESLSSLFKAVEWARAGDISSYMLRGLAKIGTVEAVDVAGKISAKLAELGFSLPDTRFYELSRDIYYRDDIELQRAAILRIGAEELSDWLPALRSWTRPSEVDAEVDFVLRHLDERQDELNRPSPRAKRADYERQDPLRKNHRP